MAVSKPILFTIDDDPQVIKAIKRDLREFYRDHYRIISTTSATEALEGLKDLKNKGEDVALLLSDQRMPEMLGVDFLEKARVLYPEALSVLLTAYSDTNAAIKAINDVKLDYYLMKPWDPPEEKLYPVLDELLLEWQARHTPEYKGIKVYGYQFSPRSHMVKDYLAGNLIPYRWMDVEHNLDGVEWFKTNNYGGEDLPVVIFDNGEVMTNPRIQDIGSRIGLSTEATQKLYDVVIIGAGPAGLGAAVYGASEGLKTLLIEKRAPGGQAGTSSKIENYLGFPQGLSGTELTRRALSQATRFGTEFLSPAEVTNISLKNKYKIVHLDNGSVITTRSIIITTGVDYRKLQAKGLGQFSGAGVYYGAANTEAQACSNKEVHIVGGGNSAGQAAIYLSNFAKVVHIIIRANDLSKSMSSYLIEQIKQTKNIAVRSNTLVVAALGEEYLERLVLRNTISADEYSMETSAIFVFIGARPVTSWLKLDLLKNEKGFIATGKDMETFKEFSRFWKQERYPYLLETSIPGIFAAGDVRMGAMNRVASAVGEGAMAIKYVHAYLSH